MYIYFTIACACLCDTRYTLCCSKFWYVYIPDQIPFWIGQYEVNSSIHTTYGGDYESQEAALSDGTLVIVCRRRWIELLTSLLLPFDEFL